MFEIGTLSDINALSFSVETNGLEKYIRQLDKISVNDNKSGLTAEEKMVMKILEAS